MRKYKTCFAMGLQNALEYRLDFFLGYFSAIFPIIIQVSMWSAIYHSAGMGKLYGYTYTQMMLYTFFVGIISRFLATGFEYEINDDIKNGGLNKYIVKPVNYCIYRCSCFMGGRAALSFIFLILVIVLLTIFTGGGYYQLDAAILFCFILALLLSLLLQFGVFFCIGMLGLWLSEISRVFPAIGIVLNVMSGGVFPMDILGEAANRILFFLPFKYLLQFPVDIITGKELGYPLFVPLIIQAFWVAIFWGLAQLIWKRGLKKYIAVGG